jgi:hypothetical protein
MGDLTDVEYSAQQAVTEWVAHVPAWLPLLAVVLVALAVAWRRHTRGGHEELSRESDAADEPVERPEEDRTRVH